MHLSSRVVQRHLKIAESFGSPKDLLQDYLTQLDQFSVYEPVAKTVIPVLEKIVLLKKNPKWNGREEYEAYNEELKKLRSEFPDRSRGHALTLVYRYGYAAFVPKARRFIHACIQQLTLPPKPRKALEAAAKFWDKSSLRFKPKSSDMEERELLWHKRYIEELEIYRKYGKLFLEVFQSGKEHSSEGEGATRLQAGPFTVVNTGGFDSDVMQAKVQLAEDCAQRLKKIGLGVVCYGDLLVTNRITSSDNTQAFYMPSKDEVFIRADSKVRMDAVQMTCHELTHRYINKFMGSKRQQLDTLYRTISRGVSENLQFPKFGEAVNFKGKVFEVQDYDIRRRSVVIREKDVACLECGQTGSHTGKDHIFVGRPEGYTMPLAMYNIAAGKENPKQIYHFVTGYAEKGGPEENFCEMVAFLCMGKLSPEMTELLKPLL